MVKHDRLSTENVPKNDSVREKKTHNSLFNILGSNYMAEKKFIDEEKRNTETMQVTKWNTAT